MGRGGERGGQPHTIWGARAPGGPGRALEIKEKKRKKRGKEKENEKNKEWREGPQIEQNKAHSSVKTQLF